MTEKIPNQKMTTHISHALSAADSEALNTDLQYTVFSPRHFPLKGPSHRKSVGVDRFYFKGQQPYFNFF
jgi:hypothetical protein